MALIPGNVGFGPIFLQKSKIERPRKSGNLVSCVQNLGRALHKSPIPVSVVELGIIQTLNQVRGAWTTGCQANADFAGELGMRRR